MADLTKEERLERLQRRIQVLEMRERLAMARGPRPRPVTVWIAGGPRPDSHCPRGQ